MKIFANHIKTTSSFFPNILKMVLFTDILKDDNDVNSKSDFIQWNYHETSHSMIQFKTEENEGTTFQKLDISNKS